MRWLWSLLAPVALLLSCVTTPPTDQPPFLYDSIAFDIACVGTLTPRPSALDQFRESLREQRLCQNTVFGVRNASRLQENLIWNPPMLHLFEGLNEGRSSKESDVRDMRVFVSYVHGSFIPPPTPGRIVCGYTYGTASFSALVDHYDRDRQEAALLLHELGHVIDLPGSDHCEDPACVMYEFVRENGARFCSKCLDRINALRSAR